ncbi:hypothetical protein ACF0H5_013213 [Mactra antiquata]
MGADESGIIPQEVNPQEDMRDSEHSLNHEEIASSIVSSQNREVKFEFIDMKKFDNGYLVTFDTHEKFTLAKIVLQYYKRFFQVFAHTHCAVFSSNLKPMKEFELV